MISSWRGMWRSLSLSQISVAVPILAAVAGALSAAAQPGGVTYAAVELAVLADQGVTQVVRALNDSDEAVGGGRPSGGRPARAFFLTRGGLEDIADPHGGTNYSTAFGINANGEVVGSANGAVAVRAFRSVRTGGTQDLGTLPGDNASQAFAINDRGDVVGYSSGATGVRAALWPRNGVPQALPGLPGSARSKALAINAEGTTVGISQSGSDTHAVLWTRGAIQDLGTLPGKTFSEAVGINSKGEVVGSSGDFAGARRAVLWAPGFAIRDLGALTGGNSSRALGVNERSQVVGTSESLLGSRAFVWTADAGMQDLNTLVAPGGGFILIQAAAINNRGTILALGRDDTGEGPDHEHDAHEFPIRVFLLVAQP
jgi:probable HAF family extracellular repeat protein